ncbi:MAG: polysaccharide biosynthesis C-terminal domain-containing protein [Rhizobiaceae bacterium]|nr:polysaccharide biosynthesis C-terminal domain-containing protein [Rhizobiaceae bacterium]
MPIQLPSINNTRPDKPEADKLKLIFNTVGRITELLQTRKNLADAATALVVRILAAALAYGVQVFLARSLALDEYGIYVTLWTWLIVANTVATFGFAESSLRFIPRYCERNQSHWALGFIKTGYLFSTIGATFVGLAALTGLWFFSESVSPSYLVPIMVLAIGLPVMALELYLEGVSRAFGWYLLTIIPGYVLRPTLIAGGILIAFRLGYTPDAAMVLGVAILVTVAIVIAQSLIIRSRLKKMFGDIKASKPKKFWVTSTLPLILATGVDELYIWSDIIILAFLVPAPEVAVYFAAQRSMSLASFIQYAFMLVSVREFSLANAMRDRKELQKRITSATRWTFWLTIPAVAITVAAGYPLLYLFGPEFVSGYSVMVVLGIGFTIRASVGQASDLLIVMGHQIANLAVSAGGLAFNIILSILLIPQYGILGAAIATTITFALRAIVLTILAKKLTGLWVLTDIPDALPVVGRDNNSTTLQQTQLQKDRS